MAANWEKFFNKKFKPVYNKIKNLKNCIHLKEGFIFKTHVYDIKELEALRSNIISHSETIGDQVNSWYVHSSPDNKKIDNEGIYQYNKHSRRVFKTIESLGDEINQRNPTFVEKISSFVKYFAKKIKKVLPILKVISEILPYSQTLAKILAPDDELKKLPSSVNIDFSLPSHELRRVSRTTSGASRTTSRASRITSRASRTTSRASRTTSGTSRTTSGTSRANRTSKPIVDPISKTSCIYCGYTFLVYPWQNRFLTRTCPRCHKIQPLFHFRSNMRQTKQ